MLACGCAPQTPRRENLPTYPNLDEAAARTVLVERAKGVRTLSAACDLTLARPDGQTVRLDGAIAMAPPDRLRLRAWKFNQAVFDLTLKPEGLWVMAGGDAARRRKVVPASLGAARLGREWAMLNGQFFSERDLTTRTEGGRMTVSRVLEDGRRLVCDVDGSTLTPRRYRMFDPAGKERFRLSLSGYGVYDGAVWPTRLAARSDEGRITVTMKNVELNVDLPPNAFTPPRRAEKQE
jgi:hypothetical protein